MFSCEFNEIFENSFFYRTPLVAAPLFRSSRPMVFLRKGFLKIWGKFTGERPCRGAISIKLLCNFFEIALWHECSSVNLLLISRTHFSKNTSGWLLLNFVIEDSKRSKILSFNSFDLLRDDFRYFRVYLVMWNRIIFTEQEIFSEAMFTWNMHKT